MRVNTSRTEATEAEEAGREEVEVTVNHGGAISRTEVTEAEEAGREEEEVTVNHGGETSRTEATEAEEAGREEEEVTIAGEDRGNKIIGGTEAEDLLGKQKVRAYGQTFQSSIQSE